jgi:hypothetical protein
MEATVRDSRDEEGKRAEKADLGEVDGEKRGKERGTRRGEGGRIGAKEDKDRREEERMCWGSKRRKSWEGCDLERERERGKREERWIKKEER